jgi:light-regulated signal transduction histidine kinase (bacteriophytochrome)
VDELTSRRKAGSTGARTLDVADCDREPIHIPGSIQPHGVLLLLADSGAVRQVSENVKEHFGKAASEVLETSLAGLLGESVAREVEKSLPRVADRRRPILLTKFQRAVSQGSRSYYAVGHRTTAGLILELEEAPSQEEVPDIHAFVDEFSLAIESEETISQLSRLTAAEVQRLTGFDRVLVYRFDADWNGLVIGEAVNDRFPSLIDHRFPASDIPAQARELYRINRVRIIPDSEYVPSRIVSAETTAADKPLDLTFSVLRSVSPVHVEYMRNMQTASSMSVSILRDGRLWGLISCHHRDAKRVPFPVRMTCDLFARAFSLRLSALEHSETYRRRIDTKAAYSTLLEVMADRGDFAIALAERPRELLSLTGAQGAALLTGEQCQLVGETPSEEEVRRLAGWLFEKVRQDVFSTDELSKVHPDAAGYKHRASGLLAISVSKIHDSYVLWFRPEVLQTIRWGGNPEKPVIDGETPPRLHPRRSFETWQETVRNRSLPWDETELSAVRELRDAIVGIVLRKAEELALLNVELTRSNQELESFSYSVSHDLRAPLRHIVGYAEMVRESLGDRLAGNDARCIANIIESSEYAGRLVDKLLSYSRLGRADLQLTTIDLNVLLEEVRRDVMRDAGDRSITWEIGPLPSVTADLMMLRMAVRDLAANAVKYTGQKERAVIQVGHRAEPGADVIWIRDNGVGFDMQYSDKLFGVFQRLHRWEDYEGTGIGLANVRRVIERHGGCTWAEAKVDEGATFYFRLPHRTENRRASNAQANPAR